MSNNEPKTKAASPSYLDLMEDDVLRRLGTHESRQAQLDAEKAQELLLPFWCRR